MRPVAASCRNTSLRMPSSRAVVEEEAIFKQERDGREFFLSLSVQVVYLC